MWRGEAFVSVVEEVEEVVGDYVVAEPLDMKLSEKHAGFGKLDCYGASEVLNKSLC